MRRSTPVYTGLGAGLPQEGEYGLLAAILRQVVLDARGTIAATERHMVREARDWLRDGTVLGWYCVQLGVEAGPVQRALCRAAGLEVWR
jgi:hypothetical protein